MHGLQLIAHQLLDSGAGSGNRHYGNLLDLSDLSQRRLGHLLWRDCRLIAPLAKRAVSGYANRRTAPG